KSHAEPRLALAKASLAGAQFSFGSFSFGDVCNESLNDLSSTPFNSGKGDLQWDLLSVWITSQELETRAAARHAFLDLFAPHDLGVLTGGLRGRRQSPRAFAD